MMNTLHRLTLIAALAALAMSACAHQPSARALQSQLTPFEQTRKQAIALVTTGKHDLGPMSINQLDVAYTDLQVKANDYTGFIVESVDVGGLDPAKNATYAARLKKSIDDFNRSYAVLQASAPTPGQPAAANLSTAWIDPFSENVRGDFANYKDTIAAATPDQKTALTQRIKRNAVWPNFEDIATERLTPQATRGH